MSGEQKPGGFVPLKALSRGPAAPAAALAEIRQIYFKTTRDTIDNDFAHAIELLKSLPDEETRAKAHVFMEGLAEMRREWERKKRPKTERPGPPEGKKKKSQRR